MDEFFRQCMETAELYQQCTETVDFLQKNMEVCGLRQIIGTGVVYLRVEMAQQWLMADMSTVVYHGTWGAILICMTAQPFLMTIWEEMSHLTSQVHPISCLAVMVITVVVSFCVKLENTPVWNHAHASLRFGGVMVNQTVRGRKMR
jgi:uncharacterized membrane protein